jgi:hypothetical protein
MATAAQALAALQKSIADLAAAAQTEEQLGSAGLISVALVNGSANFTLIPQLLEALEIQVNRDFAPLWGVHVHLSTAANPASVAAGSWYLLITDNSDQAGALGWHNQTGGQPYGEVFVLPAQQGNVALSTVLSHELLEMLADPWVDSLVQYQDAQGGQNLAPLEVCDPVENDQYNVVTSDGTQVAVSNFVAPGYFNQATKAPTLLDFMNKLTGPIPAMTAGGYISYLPITTSGTWQELGVRLAGTS